MTETAIDLIELAYRLEESDLADLTPEQLDRLATVSSIINSLCSFELARRERTRSDGD